MLLRDEEKRSSRSILASLPALISILVHDPVCARSSSCLLKDWRAGVWLDGGIWVGILGTNFYVEIRVTYFNYIPSEYYYLILYIHIHPEH
jgi:hypothetical protein